jgi:hypothetical protein
MEPGGGFATETAARQFQKRNGRYETDSEVKLEDVINLFIMVIYM